MLRSKQISVAKIKVGLIYYILIYKFNPLHAVATVAGTNLLLDEINKNHRLVQIIRNDQLAIIIKQFVSFSSMPPKKVRRVLTPDTKTTNHQMDNRCL